MSHYLIAIALVIVRTSQEIDEKIIDSSQISALNRNTK